VKEYISNCVKGMAPLSKDKSLRKVCLAVTEDDDRGDPVVVEKFVVELRAPSSANGENRDPLYVKLEQEFRSALLAVPRLFPRPPKSRSSSAACDNAKSPSDSRSFQIWTIVENQGAARFLGNDALQQVSSSSKVCSIL
jgi:hypothetical protein